MNSWIIVYLGGSVGGNLYLPGSYASLEAAIAAIASTQEPWNYQACEVWGEASVPPNPFWAPVNVPIGSWVAVTSGFSPTGASRLYGYGTFSTEAAANQFTIATGNPGSYSVGQVVAF